MPNQIAHLKRRQRIRAAIRKSANGKCRLHVHRSAQHIYAQIIDDANGKTLASASTLDGELKGKVEKAATQEAAKTVGELIAKRAQAANVSEVVFDRGGFLFHGRVKALAEAARAAGLKF